MSVFWDVCKNTPFGKVILCVYRKCWVRWFWCFPCKLFTAMQNRSFFFPYSFLYRIYYCFYLKKAFSTWLSIVINFCDMIFRLGSCAEDCVSNVFVLHFSQRVCYVIDLNLKSVFISVLKFLHTVFNLMYKLFSLCKPFHTY